MTTSRSGDSGDDADDGALLAAVAAGDREAFARLYARHAGRLVGVVGRIVGDGDQSWDVVHDVFVEAWHRVHDFDPQRGTVRAWLTIRARSRALDWWVRTETGTRAATAAGTGVESAVSANIEGHLDVAWLREGVLGLSAELADVIAGAYYEGLSAQALATRLEIPVGTVKSRLARAIAHLRGRFARGELALAV